MFTHQSTHTGSPSTPRAGDTIAGWRLVRPLSADQHEFIGVAEFSHTVSERGSEHWQGFADSTKPLLQHRRIIVAVGPDECSALANECALRDDVGSEFVDLAEETLTEDDLRIAIFPIRRVRTWAEVVSSGPSLPASALVTALVPVIETIQLAHVNAIAHGAFSLHACQFNALGRPSVDDWGSAQRLTDLPTVKADIARGNDLRALGRVVDALLALSETPPSESLRELVAALCDGVTPSDAASRLIDTLFQWAEPGPLPGSVLPTETVESPRARRDGVTLTGLLDSSSASTEEDAWETDTLLPHRDDANRHSRVGRSIGHSVSVWRERAARIVSWSGTVRPLVWGAVSLVGVLVVLSGALLMGTSANPASNLPESAATDEVSDTLEAAETTGYAQESSQSGEADAQPAESDAGTDGEVPVAASPSSLESAPTLVAARNECLALLDTDCMIGLYSTDAPGLDAELERIAVGDVTDAFISEDQEWILAADLGDIELFSGSVSGSLSLERTPDGWLLRETWLPEQGH